MKTIKVSLDFEWGQVVYLKTDSDQLPRIVTGIHLKPKDIVYQIQHADCETTYHYSFELSDEKDVVLSTSN